MPKFDVGVEGKFVFVGIEAHSGESARDQALKLIKAGIPLALDAGFTGSETRSPLLTAKQVERNWFEPSREGVK
jgi:hypothetical protein